MDGQAASGAGASATTDGVPARTAASSGSGSGALGGGLAGSEWPAKVAQTVEDVVGAVQDRAIRPILLAARAVVFGIVVASMALLLCVLIAIAAVRLLDVYAFGHRVWPADALVGAILVAGGVAAWTKRTPARAKDT
ncbi:MAG: hypothetical protein ACLP6E_02775 [Acidimicrobiales bacterium]